MSITLLVDKLQQLDFNRQPRVFSIDCDGKKYIIKQQQPPRAKISYKILTGLSKLFFTPVLQGIHIPGKKLTQDMEIKRLTALRNAGVNVPEILYECEDYVVLSHLGDTNFEELLKKTGQHTAQYHWERVLNGILQTHKQGTYLSQAFMRNIIHIEDNIAFVDFEDDPGLVMSVAEAQARDWLLCIHSSSRLLQINSRIQARILLNYLKQDSIEVQNIVLSYAPKISLLRFIFAREMPYRNRDLQSLNRFIQTMSELSRLKISEAMQSQQ
ncbi:hypothetical protein [uncultured Legionella sp.]|uniref:hypothetical protein n=1 Tax=uncultured Legionella sp. TaxID=210934 RepID=UPI00260C6F8D|nr:hypothetical protein [uncultured Legionella sp.]